MSDPTPTPADRPRPAGGSSGNGTGGNGGGSRSRSGGNRSRRGGSSRSSGGQGGSRSASGNGGGRSGGSRNQGGGGRNQGSRPRSGGGSRGSRGDHRSRNDRPAPAPVVIPAPDPETLRATSVTEAEARANHRRAAQVCWTLAAVPGVILGVILAVVVSPIVGVVVLVVVTAAAGLVARGRATGAALRAIGARPASPDREARLANLTDGLCATMGLRPPRLLVVDDAVPNACAFGSSPGDAAVVVTTGLLAALELLELEGVLAHELSHLKRRDGELSAVVVSMLGPVARLTGNDHLVHWALGRGREYRADQLASFAVRYPAGLHDALAVLAAGPAPAAGSVFEERRLAATRWVWIDPMVGRRSAPPDGELDATTVRTAALAEW